MQDITEQVTIQIDVMFGVNYNSLILGFIYSRL